jgi:hypothetical protein
MSTAGSRAEGHRTATIATALLPLTASALEAAADAPEHADASDAIQLPKQFHGCTKLTFVLANGVSPIPLAAPSQDNARGAEDRQSQT